MVGRAVTTTTQPVSKPTPSWEVRGWREGDEKLLREIDDLAFGYSAPEERWSEELATLERDRTVFVADPADPAAIIGSAGAFTFEVSVPGGRTVAAAGVSWVSVYPTHRRRGILRALMTAQLTDIAARHEPVAVLWCSEATIYGRFGYGRATSEAEVTVDRHRAGIDPAVVAGAGLRAEIGDPADSLAEVEALYERPSARFVPGCRAEALPGSGRRSVTTTPNEPGRADSGRSCSATERAPSGPRSATGSRGGRRKRRPVRAGRG
jgi:predicted N-acetyltransferase YhbS